MTDNKVCPKCGAPMQGAVCPLSRMLTSWSDSAATVCDYAAGLLKVIDDTHLAMSLATARAEKAEAFMTDDVATIHNRHMEHVEVLRAKVVKAEAERDEAEAERDWLFEAMNSTLRSASQPEYTAEEITAKARA